MIYRERCREEAATRRLFKRILSEGITELKRAGTLDDIERACFVLWLIDEASKRRDRERET